MKSVNLHAARVRDGGVWLFLILCVVTGLAVAS